MASVSATAHRRQEVPPPFGHIICGIDGSRSSNVAAEQAIALSGPSTALVFVCVREARGEAAREAGIDAAAEIIPGHDPRTLLLEEASRSDLLVVASHGGLRAGGIALGSTASAAVHRAAVPVLVARRPPDGIVFPESILVATDGSPDAERAVELTARIGHRHRATVYLLSVDPGPHGNPSRIAVDAVDLTAALGMEPTVLRTTGHADERILEAAASERVALVAVGSGGLSGARAVGSVSERVAHRAPCSVLVARPA